ncbi:hypothetical protein SDC9_43843 [bioreactor metagenome]|jgi:hypothetical protein|uniref:Reverse transcriptase domain-containing protein n=1 Tax=bioreactor metagenome TaxID=1076179 RepID=A0A644W1T6_9ZZZZ
MKQKEWFKIKSYPHIGLPLTNNDKKDVCSYVKNKHLIARHSFLPFIHKKIISRKLRKEYDVDRNPINKGKRKLLKPKERDIFFSSHLDSNIFSYYGFELNKQYNKVLEEKGLSQTITAYRQIPFYEDGIVVRNKCNIDFAYEVFKFIDNSKHDLVAISFDIKSFFDNLNHAKLKNIWCKLYGWRVLPEDHYNVFRNITKFAYIEEVSLFKLFQNQIITKTKSGTIKEKKVDKLKYLYNSGTIAYCNKQDIHLIRKSGLIKSNKYDIKTGKLRDYGICQGSPISSVLANLYLLEFDEKINNYINNINGLYRRYSDDMIIVCNPEQKTTIIKLVEESIEKMTKLTIQADKTQIFLFQYDGKRKNCLMEINGIYNHNSHKYKLDYLGFSYDGKSISIKTGSLAKYYRRMKLNIRRCNYYSQTIQNETKGELFVRRLYKRFSYIGANRKMKFKRKPGTKDQWIKSKKYNWGNYITYAKLAYRTINDYTIKSQIKKHWRNLNKLLVKTN